MQVNKVEVRPFEKNKMRAFLTVTLGEGGEDLIVLKDWTLIQGRDGLFATSPSKQYDGKWYNQTLVFGDLRQQINDAAITAYNREMGKSSSNDNTRDSAQGSAGRAQASSGHREPVPF